MYRAGPPAVSASGAGGLTITRAARRIFPESSDAARDPTLRRYLDDLVRPYGVGLREAPFEAGCGQSYGEMAAALLPGLVRPDEPVDLLVCTFTVSDVIPARSTAAYLSDLCPGGPTGFAVCDQGIAAPYTALRLLTACNRTASCQRSVLVVTEQSTQHYDLPAPAPMPAVHAGVTLLLTGLASDRPPSDPAPSDRVPADRVPADRVPAAAVSAAAVSAAVSKLGRAGSAPRAPVDLHGRLALELPRLAGERDDVTLVIGAGLSGHRATPWHLPASWEIIDAPVGQPCTGTWWELADCLDRWQGTGRRVLLADYDPRLDYLCTASIDLP